MKRYVYTIDVEPWRPYKHSSEKSKKDGFTVWRFKEAQERYAKKHGAEYIYDKQKPKIDPFIHPWHIRYMRLAELFAKEECEVLFLDGDVYPTKSAPWLKLNKGKCHGKTLAGEKEFNTDENHAVQSTLQIYKHLPPVEGMTPLEQAQRHRTERFYFNAGVQLYRFPEAYTALKRQIRLTGEMDYPWDWNAANWCGGDQAFLAWASYTVKDTVQTFPREYNMMSVALTKKNLFPKGLFFIHMAGRNGKQLVELYKNKFATALQVDMPEGLGDTIKRFTNILGIKECSGCNRRRKKFNKVIPWKKKKNQKKK